MSRETKQTFSRRRHIYGPQAGERMLYVTNHQGNENQNDDEAPPLTVVFINQTTNHK